MNKTHHLTATIGISVAAALLSGTGAARAASPKAPPKPKASVANFCKASKAWLAYENATLAKGPYDVAWVQNTKQLMENLVSAAPKGIQPQTLRLGAELFGTRSDLVRGLHPDLESALENLNVEAFLLSRPDSKIIGARDAVGVYAQKNCDGAPWRGFRSVRCGRVAVWVDDDLCVGFGVAERVERVVDPVEADGAGDEWGGVDLAVGEEVEGVAELEWSVADDETQVDFLVDGHGRSEPVGFHAHSGDDDPSVHRRRGDDLLDDPGYADAFVDDRPFGFGGADLVEAAQHQVPWNGALV